MQGCRFRENFEVNLPHPLLPQLENLPLIYYYLKLPQILIPPLPKEKTIFLP